jgi:serine protease AprX
MGHDYFSLAGTSMATPICAGVAALLLEANPELTPDDVKGRLQKGAEPMGPANTYGS